jgi:protein TonB
MPLADVPLATFPVNTKVESDAVFPLPLPPVAAQGVPDEIVAMPSPAPAAINTAELADLLWRRMEALKRYPGLARRNGWEGMVLIKVVLGGDGRLLSADIQQSSGYETLDQDALRVLRAATPLKNEEIPVGQQQAAFMLPVPYRLQH